MKKLWLCMLVVVMVMAVQANYLLAQDAASGGKSGETAPAAPAADAPASGTQGTAADNTDTGGGAPAEGQPGEQQNRPRPNMLESMWPLLLIFVVLYFFMFRGPKRRQQQHQQMLNALQKNSRVRTIGGIIGTVVDVRDDEVVLKIDESTNTKMRVTRQAISKVYGEGEDEKR